jgi:hypothetical protein
MHATNGNNVNQIGLPSGAWSSASALVDGSLACGICFVFRRTVDLAMSG